MGRWRIQAGQAADWLARHRRGTGLAQAYAFVVLAVSASLCVLPDALAHRLVLDSSTNLHNLRHDPVTVLVVSAFVVWPVRGLWIVPVLLAVYGAAQRWLGAAATVVAACLGHAGATLAVASLLAADISVGRLDPSVTSAPDVGVSYGLVAVAALLTARLPVRHRHRYAAALVAYCLAPTLADPDFTGLGHLVAAGIGFALAVIAARAARSRPGRPAADSRRPARCPSADLRHPVR